MGNEERPIVKLALAEVDGKNKAIHAYDQMIWTVRSGFATLFFAAWGLVLKDFITVERLSWRHAGILGGLAAFSVVLAYAAQSIDRNYAKRKSRVIVSLNALMRALEEEPLRAASLAPHLRVAGDLDTADSASAGSQPESWVGQSIYGLSLLALLLGLILVFAGAMMDGSLGTP